MKTIEIRNEMDIVQARQTAREEAEAMGYSIVDKTRIATAVSELARNVYVHAGGGRMEIQEVRKDGRIGLSCVFIDNGPGIPDIEQAMSDGFTTGSGLGHGLPGSRRLMDTFSIESEVGKGTRIEVIKWKA